jgi:hypothetical protein
MVARICHINQMAKMVYPIVRLDTLYLMYRHDLSEAQAAEIVRMPLAVFRKLLRGRVHQTAWGTLRGVLKRLRLALGIDAQPELHSQRPRKRSDCIGGVRPCPWVGCKYHLALDVTENGSIRHAKPGIEVEDMGETCALDVADRGSHTLEEIAGMDCCTRERIRQVQDRALAKLKALGVLEPPEERGEWVHPEPVGYGHGLREARGSSKGATK